MKTIYLVRHGETLANRQGILQGWSNNPLDDTGRKQAAALVTRASRVPLDAIYTSDLIRTRETAAPLAEARGLEPTVLPGLREISFGKWDGHHLKEIQEKDPDTLRDIFLKPGQVDLEAEEDLAASQERAWETFTDLAESMDPDGTILCVSHGGPDPAPGVPDPGLFHRQHVADEPGQHRLRPGGPDGGIRVPGGQAERYGDAVRPLTHLL